MAVTNRAAIAQQLEPGLNAVLGDSYNLYPEEWRDIYTVETSERAFEEEVMMAGMAGAVTKGEGANVSFDSIGETWIARYNHETIALAGAITEEALDDNLYKSVGKRIAKALGRSLAHTKNVKGVNPLVNGFTGAAVYNTGDGVSLFNTAHPLASGETDGNRPTADTDLSETALETAFFDIGDFIDERGLPVRVKPRRLIIPLELTFEAKRILGSNGRVGTADNDLNAIRDVGVFPEGFSVNHYLTDTDAWFILTDCPDGAKHFARRARREQMDEDFHTGNLLYKVSERYSFGISDWRILYGTSGA